MDVFEAVSARRSIRDFSDKPVSEALLREVLSAALRSPSGGNLQPWHLHVLAGQDLQDFVGQVRELILSGVRSEETEYDIYPSELPSPYRDRRFKVAEDMYARIGIPREDKAKRMQWFLRNFEGFGAPVLMLCSVDRCMGKPQWADLGMFFQTVMLLLKARGLDSCPQEAWALYPQTIRKILDLPDERMFFAGMSIGYAKPESAVNALRTERASLDEIAAFRGFAAPSPSDA